MPGMKIFAFFALVFVLGSIIGGVSEGTAGISVTALSADVDAAVTTVIIPVDSTEGFPNATHPVSQRHIVIGREVIQYTALSLDGLTFTGCTRGDEHPRTGEPSNAAAHSEDDMVMVTTASAINNLMGVFQASSSSLVGTITNLVFSSTFWNALWQMLMWDYAYLGGMLTPLRILLMVVFSGGFLFGIVMGAISVVQGLFVR